MIQWLAVREVKVRITVGSGQAGGWYDGANMLVLDRHFSTHKLLIWHWFLSEISWIQLYTNCGWLHHFQTFSVCWWLCQNSPDIFSWRLSHDFGNLWDRRPECTAISRALPHQMCYEHGCERMESSALKYPNIQVSRTTCCLTKHISEELSERIQVQVAPLNSHHHCQETRRGHVFVVSLRLR